MTVVTMKKPEPSPIVLFYTIEGDLQHTICADGNLFKAVREIIFPGVAALGQDQADEIAAIDAALIDTGHVDLGDDWISGFKDVVSLTEFLIDKLREQREETRFADEQRYEQRQRADHFADKYNTLARSLAAAINHAALRTVAGVPGQVEIDLQLSAQPHLASDAGIDANGRRQLQAEPLDDGCA